MAEDYYWVRPRFANGELGAASAFVGGGGADLPALSLDPLTPADSGNGTQGSLYQLASANQYIFVLLSRPGGDDVSADPNAQFFISPAAAGIFTDNFLTLSAGYSGSFTVSATYLGVPIFAGTEIYCMRP